MLNSVFDKQLNTFNLNSGLELSRGWGKYFLSIDENFRSTVIKSNKISIKDEQYFTFLNSYQLNSLISLGLSLKNNIYSDDRQLAINKTSTLHTEVFSKITPLPKIEIVPFFGLSQNQQTAVTDKGYIYGSEAFINNLEVHDFIIDSKLKFQNEDIAPRKNTFRFLNLNLLTRFENNANNKIALNYTEQRRDFYFDPDSITSAHFNINNNIESRTESRIDVQNRFFYFSPLSNLGLNFNGRVSWRNIDRDTRYISLENVTQSTFDTEIEEFKIDLASTATYKVKDFRGQIRAAYAEREERHSAKEIEGANQIFYEERKSIESQKNNISKQVTFSLSGTFDISYYDKISLSIFHRKMVYDTPSRNNFDDRDELLSMVKLSYTHKLNYFFDLFANLEGSLNKLVYIFAERSSNNNIKRFLKLTSNGVYKSRNFRSVNSAEVSANYTVFDYEELNPNFKSFSFRQLAIRDSSQLKINTNLRADFYGYIKFSEQGDFKWNNFTGQPVRFLQETYLEPKLFYIRNGMEFGIGLRYFNLTTFNYTDANERELATEYNSIGPLAEINVVIHNRLLIKLYGYFEFISTESNSIKEEANLNLRLNWVL